MSGFWLGMFSMLGILFGMGIACFVAYLIFIYINTG